MATGPRITGGDLSGRRDPRPVPANRLAVQEDRLQPFLSELQHDDDVDESTKGMVTELAEDPTFLLAVEDYVKKTQIIH